MSINCIGSVMSQYVCYTQSVKDNLSDKIYASQTHWKTLNVYKLYDHMKQKNDGFV